MESSINYNQELLTILEKFDKRLTIEKVSNYKHKVLITMKWE